MSEPDSPEPADDAIAAAHAGSSRPAGPASPPTRPRQASMAAILLIVFGGLGILLALLLLSLVSDEASHGSAEPGIVYALFYGQLILSAAEALSGVFVWLGRGWARTLAIVLCSINILSGVLSLFTGVAIQAIIGAVINIALIRLLASSEVGEWCR